MRLSGRDARGPEESLRRPGKGQRIVHALVAVQEIAAHVGVDVFGAALREADGPATGAVAGNAGREAGQPPQPA